MPRKQSPLFEAYAIPRFMRILATLGCALLGFLVTWGAIALILKRWRPRPTSADQGAFHHTHQVPVPRFGGVALVAAFLALATIALVWLPVDDPDKRRVQWAIVLTVLGMFLLGLWDDIRPLGARKKLLGQIMIATAACYSGIGVDYLQNPLDNSLYNLAAWGWIFSIFWLVALTNVVNLIDGIDGLAGGIALMLMCLLTYGGFVRDHAFLVLCTGGMCGALLAFLKYNFPPARIYLGDGGAYFLGSLIGALTLVHSEKGTVVAALIAPLFALALPITDVGLAVLRRGLRGLPIFRADRRHIHHRLLALGLSRTRAVLILYGISLVFLLLAFAVFWSQGRLVPILLGCACLILLFSARSFSFSRGWFGVGRVLGNCLEVRKETQCALALGRWLEMEAERADSIAGLWSDFQFLARKLGFARVALSLQDEERVWAAPDAQAGEPVFHTVQELNGGAMMRVEFTMRQDKMSSQSFGHLAEILAECWFKAALRWQRCNRLPVRFDARLEVGRPGL